MEDNAEVRGAGPDQLIAKLNTDVAAVYDVRHRGKVTSWSDAILNCFPQHCSLTGWSTLVIARGEDVKYDGDHGRTVVCQLLAFWQPCVIICLLFLV